MGKKSCLAEGKKEVFVFDLGGTDKVICLTCTQVKSVLKEYYVKHHHETNLKSCCRFSCVALNYVLAS